MRRSAFGRGLGASRLVGLASLAGLAASPLVGLGAARLVGAQASQAISGVVFVDGNGNGSRDSGEAGLAGVAVSNQRDVAVTGADGSYRLPGAGTGVLFVSVPDGQRSVGPFWRAAGSGSGDFALQPRSSSSSFTFIHASDTHISQANVVRTARLRLVAAERKADFVLVTGDLVRDALRVGEAEARGYYDLYVQQIGQFAMPVWSVPGNHENFGIERNLSKVSASHPLYGKAMYRSRLGPTYYSFNYGGIHFVGLDSVDVDDTRYYGHVDAAQLAWLKADLATLKPGATVVTFNHIPFVGSSDIVNGYEEDGPAPSLITVGGHTVFRHIVSNLREVLPLLTPYDWTLALGGHYHTAERVRFQSAVRTRFHQAAAVTGPTTGVIPAISGVTLYRVTRGAIDDGTFIPFDPF